MSYVTDTNFYGFLIHVAIDSRKIDKNLNIMNITWLTLFYMMFSDQYITVKEEIWCPWDCKY